MSLSAATQPVLFLHAEWRPLRVDCWQDAIADFFLGKVEVVEYSRDRMMLSIGGRGQGPIEENAQWNAFVRRMLTSRSPVRHSLTRGTASPVCPMSSAVGTRG